MKAKKLSIALRNKILFLSGLFLVISFTCYPIQSDDLFMYLAIARNAAAHFKFPILDPFLYSLSDYKWTILHQWIGYLIFYVLYNCGGFNLIIVVKSLLITLAIALPARLIKRPTEKLIWAASLFFSINAMAFRLMERTSLFSDCFILLLLVLIVLELERPSKLKFGIPILFLAWVNIHPLFPLGWGLCFLFLLINWRQKATKSYQQFALMTFISIVICLINPKGLAGVLYPFNFVTNEGKVFRDYYFEWMPTLSPIYRFQPHTFFLAGLTIMNLLLLWICRKSKPIFEIVASLAFIVFGFYAIRFVPTMCFALIALNSSLSRKLPEYKLSEKINFLVAMTFMGLAIKNIFFGYQTISGPRKFGFGLDPNVIPVKAAEIVLKTPQIGNVFNSHMFGSYLAWAWLEQRKIFYHGFVTDTNLFLNEYASFSMNPQKFHEQVAKYRIGAFLLDRFQGNERLLQILVQDPQWALAYKDENSLIFLPLKSND